MSRPPSRTLVIGLGNPLMGDDGAGVAALDRLRNEWDLPEDVELVDGGTWGMNLLPLVESTGHLVLVDAIRSGASCPATSRSSSPLIRSISARCSRWPSCAACCPMISWRSASSPSGWRWRWR